VPGPSAARVRTVSGEESQSPDDRPGEALRLRRLEPPSEPVTVAAFIEELALSDRTSPPGARPRVMLNMVATADGRATVGGRSGTISDRADRELFHGLRSAVDGVLVGAGTIRTEHYGRMIRDASVREARRAAGRSEEPLACIVSGRLALPEDIPLLNEPEARVVMLTASAASLTDPAAQVDYIRGPDGQLDLVAAIAEIGERFDVRTLLCEGGPHLARQLLAAGLMDEIFLSISPLLAGGEPAGGEALRILAGAELDPPAALDLLGVLRCGSTLFLRYGVSAGGTSD
jgi:riboflavin biosynthesis pyrimidine reductase